MLAARRANRQKGVKSESIVSVIRCGKLSNETLLQFMQNARRYAGNRLAWIGSKPRLLAVQRLLLSKRRRPESGEGCRYQAQREHATLRRALVRQRRTKTLLSTTGGVERRAERAMPAKRGSSELQVVACKLLKLTSRNASLTGDTPTTASRRLAELRIRERREADGKLRNASSRGGGSGRGVPVGV